MDIERFVLVTETPFEGTTSFLVQKRLRRQEKLIDDPAVVRLPGAFCEGLGQVVGPGRWTGERGSVSSSVARSAA
jgi:hypothetical protein